MSGIVYLLKTKDLYRICEANKAQNIQRFSESDSIIITKVVNQPTLFKARLLRKYKSNRIPDTNYFRFDKLHLEDCIYQLSEKSEVPETFLQEFSITLFASLLIIVCLLFVLLLLPFGFREKLSISLLLGSLPLWAFLLLGNFGGYHVNDLRLFCTTRFRLLSLLLATLVSYIGLYFHVID